MIKIGYEQIITKIKEEKRIDEFEIKERIDKKLRDLSGLISKEGAAHIVANELGIRLLDNLGKSIVKINELLIGMRRVGVVGRVTSIFGVNSFKTEKREGRVGSFIIGDETSKVRVVMWDDKHIKDLDNNSIVEGSIVKIENGYVRESNGFKELHLNGYSSLVINPEGVTIENVITNHNPMLKKKISDLKGDEISISLIGYIVQMFEPRFYDACSLCGKKALVEDGKARCMEHGVTSLVSMPVVNFFLDDGSGNIRAVAFRDQAVKLLNYNGDINDLRNPEIFENLRLGIEGNQYMFSGRVTKNEMFDRIEFIVRNVQEVDPNILLNQ